MGLRKWLLSFTKGSQAIEVFNEAVDQIDKNTEQLANNTPQIEENTEQISTNTDNIAANKKLHVATKTAAVAEACLNVRGENDLGDASPKWSLSNLYDWVRNRFAAKGGDDSMNFSADSFLAKNLLRGARAEIGDNGYGQLSQTIASKIFKFKNALYGGKISLQTRYSNGVECKPVVIENSMISSYSNQVYSYTNDTYGAVSLTTSAEDTHKRVKSSYYRAGVASYNAFIYEDNKITAGRALYAPSFSPFTGCHICIDEGQKFQLGELICIEDIYNKHEEDNILQPSWSARYTEKGEQGIFGIVYGYNIEPIIEDYEEEVIIKRKFKKDKKETVIKQKQIGERKTWSIACTGDCRVFTCCENGDISYGDKLTSSSKNGVAMKANPDNVVIGIAGSSIKFKDKNEVILLSMTKE